MKSKAPTFRFSNAMLIDDSELDNFINEKILEANHFAKKIYRATAGRSALEFLNNLLVLGKDFENAYPAVIFVDINMPIMDGFQFIEQFKKIADRLHNPRLVILTSSVSASDRAKAESLSPGMLFLNKPLSAESLSRI
jgi:CheY-like chemotaxis protein